MRRTLSSQHSSLPPFVAKRMALFDSLLHRRQQQMSVDGERVEVTLNNLVVPAVAGICSPASLFAGYMLYLCDYLCVRGV